ncbi:hypothetical protein [Mycobacterium sp. Root265]|uniref:hypothetical protein n=1 Tax=Mycobacterium sp. Root265 TaxID=1736504 RepID=UPI000A7B3F23|nr:hypothetical protein [Mycobacterium sp. Root265]
MKGDTARTTGVVTRGRQEDAQHGVCWDALRANAIGSLWGRSAAEPRIAPGDLWALRADRLR